MPKLPNRLPNRFGSLPEVRQRTRRLKSELETQKPHGRGALNAMIQRPIASAAKKERSSLTAIFDLNQVGIGVAFMAMKSNWNANSRWEGR